MNQSEYEKLIKQGYTEEEIDLSLYGVSRIELFDEPMGEAREDRGVMVKDSEGLEKRTSSIMMGYNRKGITLENGEYVSWEEVEQVLETTLNTDEEEITYVSRKTGKKVEPSEIVEDLFKRSTEKTHLSHRPTDKITNQQAAQMTVHDEKKGDFPKGVSMLGNDGIQLPSGKYVSKAEIELAINDYVRLKGPVVGPPIPPDPPGPKTDPIDEPIHEPESKKEQTPIEQEKYRVIQRIYRQFSWIPLAVGALAEFLAGFGQEDVIVQQEILRKATKLSYDTSKVQKLEEEFETSTKVAERLFEDIDTGKKINMPSGVSYYESSDYKYGGANKQGVFGKGLRQEGEYNIDGFSILKDGKIHEVEFAPGENLYSKLEGISKQTGTPIEALIPMIHMGGPVAGWVDARDLFDVEEKKPQPIGTKVILDEEKKYDGVIEDFQGDTITINNGTEDITLKIKNEDGTFVQDGDIIIGSDGQKYQMTDIEVTNVEVIDVEDVKTGTKVNWSFKNITLEEHLAAAAIALAGTAISLRKKKEMVDMTDSQIKSLIAQEKKEFIDVKGQYEGTSAFKHATETLVGKQIQPPLTAQDTLRTELITHNITVEDITNLSDTMGGRTRK